MEQLKHITIKMTTTAVSQFYGLLVELLVGVTEYDQLMAAYVVKDLTLRIGRGRDPWAAPEKKVSLRLSPAEALAVRELILSENLIPAMTAVARNVMMAIDPLLPSPECFALLVKPDLTQSLPETIHRTT